ncbi:hypothetical protein ACKKBG_A11095 [Auxenochlorella protothecoides x Auxenochlorella symbiontica]
MKSGPARRRIQSLQVSKCSLGCPILDAFLGGGLSSGSITELVGEATTAKTQLCLQALVHARLSLGGSGVYIYTEGDPPLDRLHQLAQAAVARRNTPLSAGDVVAGVFVERGVDCGEALLARVKALQPLLARAAGTPAPVRLLVVDSLAAPLRDLGPSPGRRELLARAQTFFRLAAALRALADRHGFAVLVTNQVTDVVAGPGAALARSATGGAPLLTSGREVTPALGLAWASCVNTRLFAAHAAGGGAPGPRVLHLVWGPGLGARRCEFVVGAGGVRGRRPEGPGGESMARRP